MRQPAETVSNVFYAAGGAFLIVSASDIMGVAAGIASVALSVGSALYHGTRKSYPVPGVGQRLDEIGMYLVLSAIASMAWLGPGDIAFLAWVPLAFLLAVLHDYIDSPLVVGILTIIALAGIAVDHTAAAAVLAALMVAAVGLRYLGERRHSPILHVAWHFITAVVIVYGTLTAAQTAAL